MKRRDKSARKQGRVPLDGPGADFVRGFVSTALLGGLKERNPRRLLRLALQGGVALCAASVVARANTKRSIVPAVGAVLAGYVGLQLIEQMASASSQAGERTTHPPHMKGSEHGQET